MRVYTHTEPERRILAWSGVIAALVLYGGSFVEEYEQTGAVTAWWPVAIFWTIVITAAGRVLMTPRQWVDIDEHSRRVTVYRDGSRDNQVLSTGATDKAKSEREGVPSDKRELAELKGTMAELDAEIERLKKALYDAEAETLQRRQKRSRPDKLRGTSIRKETPLGTMYVHIAEDG